MDHNDNFVDDVDNELDQAADKAQTAAELAKQVSDQFSRARDAAAQLQHTAAEGAGSAVDSAAGTAAGETAGTAAAAAEGAAAVTNTAEGAATAAAASAAAERAAAAGEVAVSTAAGAAAGSVAPGVGNAVGAVAGALLPFLKYIIRGAVIVFMLLLIVANMVPSLIFGVVNDAFSRYRTSQEVLNEIVEEQAQANSTTGSGVNYALAYVNAYIRLHWEAFTDTITNYSEYQALTDDSEVEAFYNEQLCIDSIELKVEGTQNRLEKRAEDLEDTIYTDDYMDKCTESASAEWLQALSEHPDEASVSWTVSTPGDYSEAYALALTTAYSTQIVNDADDSTVTKYLQWLGYKDTDWNWGNFLCLINGETKPWIGTYTSQQIWEEIKDVYEIINFDDSLTDAEKKEAKQVLLESYAPEYMTALINYLVVVKEPTATTWLEERTSEEPVYDEDGNPEIDEDGNPVTETVSYNVACGIVTYKIEYTNLKNLDALIGFWQKGTGEWKDQYNADDLNSNTAAGTVQQVSYEDLEGLSNEEKIELLGPICAYYGQTMDVLPSVGLGMMCFETGYFENDLTKYANNVGSIKKGDSWDGDTYTMSNSDGADIQWRKYDSITDGIEDYFTLISTASRYAAAVGESDPGTCLEAILDAGYAGSDDKSNYKSQVMSIISTYDLTQYDTYDISTVTNGSGSGQFWFDDPSNYESISEFYVLDSASDSGYPDETYSGYCVSGLTEQEQKAIVNTIFNEQGGNLNGAILVAQSLRDAYLYMPKDGTKSTPQTIQSLICTSCSPSYWYGAGSVDLTDSNINDVYSEPYAIANYAFQYVWEQGNSGLHVKIMGWAATYDDFSPYYAYRIAYLGIVNGVGEPGYVWGKTQEWYDYVGDYFNPNAEVTLATGSGKTMEESVAEVLEKADSRLQELGYDSSDWNWSISYQPLGSSTEAMSGTNQYWFETFSPTADEFTMADGVETDSDYLGYIVNEVSTEDTKAIIYLIKKEAGNQINTSMLIAQALRDTLLYSSGATIRSVVNAHGSTCWDEAQNIDLSDSQYAYAKRAYNWVFTQGNSAIQHKLWWWSDPSTAYSDAYLVVSSGSLNFWSKEDFAWDTTLNSNVSASEQINTAVTYVTVQDADSIDVSQMENYGLNKDSTFNAGNVAGIWVAGMVYKAAQEGYLTIADYEDTIGSLFAGTGSTQDVQLSLIQTVGTARGAEDPLAGGITYLNSLLHGWGLTASGYSSDSSTTTAADCQKLLTAIYGKSFVSEQASIKLTAYLTEQPIVNLIPAGIPDTVLTVNEPADEGNSLGDTALVYTDIPYEVTIDAQWIRTVHANGMSLGDVRALVEETIVELSDAIYNQHLTNMAKVDSATSLDLAYARFPKNFLKSNEYFYSERYGFYDAEETDTLTVMKNQLAAGRDEDFILLYEYTGTDGDSTITRSVAYEDDIYEDELTNAADMAGISLSFLSSGSSRSSRGGNSIAEVAQKEYEERGGSVDGDYYWNTSFPGSSRDSQPWCCAFVCYCANEAYGDDYTSAIGSWTASCATLVSQVRSISGDSAVYFPGDGTVPQAGDLVLYWNGQGRTGSSLSDLSYVPDHIGIVTGGTDTTFDCVEGNANGGTVAAYTRSITGLSYGTAYVQCFIRPDWPAALGGNYSESDHSAIQEALKSALYGSSTSYVSCDFDGYSTVSGRHEGIDICSGAATSEYAIIDGTVLSAYRGSTTILFVYNYDLDMTVSYMHLNIDSAIQTGDTIKAGDLIGTEGANGRVTGPHTHLEINTGKRTSCPLSSNSTLENPDPYPLWAEALNYQYG